MFWEPWPRNAVVMDYSRPLPVPDGTSDCDVIMLRCHDKLVCDRRVLAQVLACKTAGDADDMVCRILEHLAYWLDVLQHGFAAGRADICGKAARRIALVAGQIGLTGLACVARHVTQCLQMRDRVALAAVMGRLERAFDLTALELWQFRDP